MIIASCWVNDAKLRPSLSEVTSGINAILSGDLREGHQSNVLITITDKPPSMTGKDDVKSEDINTAFQLVQGEVWKSVQINNDEIVNEKVIGQVSARVIFIVCSRKQPMSDTKVVSIVVLLLRETRLSRPEEDCHQQAEEEEGAT